MTTNRDRASSLAPLHELTPVVATFVAGGVGVVSFRYASDRFDFAAHYVAGLGGTMLLLAALWLWHRSRPNQWPVVLVVVGSSLLGVVGEVALFPGGGFDMVDVANQSLGAVTAGLIYALAPIRGAVAIIWTLLALAFLLAGARLVGVV